MPEPDAENKPENRKKIILVVDDHPDYLYVLRIWLDDTFKSEHFEIITAKNAADALKIVRDEERRPNLIIADIIMPGLDGLNLCRILKFDKNFKDIPIIIISSIPGIDVTEKIKKVRADDFFSKPVDMEKFLERVRELLAAN